MAEGDGNVEERTAVFVTEREGFEELFGREGFEERNVAVFSSFEEVFVFDLVDGLWRIVNFHLHCGYGHRRLQFTTTF